jgi:hypothetical protein
MTLDPLALWTIQDLADYFQVARRSVDKIRFRTGFPTAIYPLGPGTTPRWRAGAVMDWCESQHCPETVPTSRRAA